MYRDGSIVSLIENKSHGEGEDIITLSSGTCGMIARATRKTDNNHLYVVDFGPYGQWYCFHNELNGDDTEGWEEDTDERERATLFTETEPTMELAVDGQEEKESHVIDVERDIAKRMAEIEKGNF